VSRTLLHAATDRPGNWPKGPQCERPATGRLAESTIGCVPVADAVESLHRSLLTHWNERNATGYSALFTEDGSVVGFDGSCVESPASIAEHLQSIFADHEPATYVANVREVRPLGSGVALLRSVAGMVPPGGSDINPAVNAVQVLVAVQRDAGCRPFHVNPSTSEVVEVS
jgi:uncharacterized protein (TIGR02246 family)